MAKYKVNKQFRDKYTKEVYKTNQEIDMTVKRATEVMRNLGDDRLERLDAPTEKE